MFAYGRLDVHGVVAVAVVATFRHHHTGQQLHGEVRQGAVVTGCGVREGLEIHELRGGHLLEVAHRLQFIYADLVGALWKALREIVVEEPGGGDAAPVLVQRESEYVVLGAAGEDGEDGHLTVQRFDVVGYRLEAQERAEGEVLEGSDHLKRWRFVRLTAYWPCWYRPIGDTHA